MKDYIKEPMSFIRRNSKRYSDRFNRLRKSSSVILKRSSWAPLKVSFLDDLKIPKRSKKCRSSEEIYVPEVALFKSTPYLYNPGNESCYYSSTSSISSRSRLSTNSSSFGSESFSDHYTSMTEYPIVSEGTYSNFPWVPTHRIGEDHYENVSAKRQNTESDSSSNTSPKIVGYQIKCKCDQLTKNERNISSNTNQSKSTISSDEEIYINEQYNTSKDMVHNAEINGTLSIPDVSIETNHFRENHIDSDMREVLEVLHMTNLLSDGESDFDSEGMNNTDEEYFERNLDTELGANNEDEDFYSNPVRKFKDVQLRRKNKLQLYIDIEKARTFRKNDRQLKRIKEENFDSDSIRSSSSTPRSPAIDFDEAFNKEEGFGEYKDNLSKVKYIAKQLNFNTNEDISNAELMKTLKITNSRDGIPIVIENKLKLPTSKKALSLVQRETNVSNAISWIRKELTEMKSEDEKLAEQFIQLRFEIQKLRLVSSCSRHEQMLQNAALQNEKQKSFTTVHCDLPNSYRDEFSSQFQHIGLTQMNFSQRRFSLL